MGNPVGTEPLTLIPAPSALRRGILAAALAFAAFFLAMPFEFWLTGALVIVAICGTFRTFTIDQRNLYRRLTLAFIPLPLRRWELSQFMTIETDCTSQMEESDWDSFMAYDGGRARLRDLLDFILFLIGLALPSLFGELILRLRDHDERRVLAWRGRGDHRFSENLATLEDITQLPVRRG